MTDRELIQPEQEPVAYVCWSNHKNADGTLTNFRSWLSHQPEGYVYQPLYTAPPKREWQGLTDEEISEISKNIPSKTDLWVAKFVFAREIEAKLREKND